MALEWSQPKIKKPELAITELSVGILMQKCVFYFGGRRSNKTIILDMENRSWVVPRASGVPPEPREHHSAATVGHKIFIFGGHNGKKRMNDLYLLRTENIRWEHVNVDGAPPAVDGHTMTALGDQLVIFGGATDHAECTNGLSVFDTHNRIWQTVKCGHPPVPRSYHSADVVRGRLYVFGGKGISSCFNDVNVFHPAMAEWTQPEVTGILPAGRWGHSTVVIDNKIFVFGGCNGTWSFNDLHQFDCASKTWSKVFTTGSPPPARCFHSCLLVGNEMIVVGGRDGTKQLTDTFSLDVTRYTDPSSLGKQSQESIKKAQGYEYKLSDFEMKQTLGTGSFGRVRLCRLRSTGKYYAIKILQKAQIIKTKQTDHILNEKSILYNIDHPFIVNLKASFQDKKYLFLVMDYVPGGEFFTHLRRARRFNNKTAKFYAAHVVLAFQYLHSKDIVYRDLKPENLLIDERGHLKITDFGFAKRVEYRTWTLCGTPEYIAPEILLNKGHGKPVDWWALGILIFEMLAGNAPFVDDSPLKIYKKIVKGEIKFPPYFNEHAKDLIQRLLEIDTSKRYGCLKNGVNDIKNHRWFRGLDWTSLYNYKVKAPWVPSLSGDHDTRNFETYPEDETVAADIDVAEDPFKDF